MKKYKRVKKRLGRAVQIVESLRRELERYRFDNNDVVRFEDIRSELLDMSRKSNSKVRSAIPRSQTPLINYQPGESSKIEFKVPLPRPANCSSARNASRLDNMPSKCINSSRVLCEHRTPCEN